jgi:hypothetical protein
LGKGTSIAVKAFDIECCSIGFCEAQGPEQRRNKIHAICAHFQASDFDAMLLRWSSFPFAAFCASAGGTAANSSPCSPPHWKDRDT